MSWLKITSYSEEVGGDASDGVGSSLSAGDAADGGAPRLRTTSSPEKVLASGFEGECSFARTLSTSPFNAMY